MNVTFKALLNEADFTKEILISGVSQIRKANYSQKGYYFESFTSLSTGLERIGKLCLLLDCYIQNGGQFQDLKHLKNKFKHDLNLLYLESKNISHRLRIQFKYLDNLDFSIHQKMISILSKFAIGDRYSNIDILDTKSKINDPIAEWHNNIDKKIYEEMISKSKKEQISSNAQMIENAMLNSGKITFISEDGTIMNDFKSSSLLIGMKNAIIPYRQLYITQIIRYWVELLTKLQYIAIQLGKQEIPFFNEMFAVFYNDDAFLKSRKNLRL